MSAKGNQQPGSLHVLSPKPPPPGDDEDNMKERLARVEEAMEGIKRVQGYTFTLMSLFLAIFLAFAGYVINRTDNLEGKVDALPGKISSDLQTLTSTLAQSITAAKQQQPQVIMIPTPQQPSRQPSKPQ